MNYPDTIAVIVAGGKGRRMESATKKQYLRLNQIPILSLTIRQFDRCRVVRSIILVIPRTDESFCREHIVEPYKFTKPVHLVHSGEKRQDSAYNGVKFLKTLTNSTDETIVLVHDGVRPFVSGNLISESVQNALRHGACVPGIKLSDTIKQAGEGNRIHQTIKRDNLYAVQTPQAFQLHLLAEAFENAIESGFIGTDDASLVEQLGKPVVVIDGDKHNIKITTPEDLKFAEFLVQTV